MADNQNEEFIQEDAPKERNCGFIADIAFEANDKFRKIGRVFYDFDHGKPSLLYRGFRTGSFVAKPYPGVEKIPYIQGDITIPVPHSSRVERNPEYDLWLGWIYTETKGNEEYYVIRLEVDPWPLVVARRFRQFSSRMKREADSRIVNGLWLYIRD